MFKPPSAPSRTLEQAKVAPTPMSYREYSPPEALRHSVRCLWLLEEEHTSRTEEHLFFPERSVRLVFYQGEAYLGTVDGPLEAMPNSYLMGFQNGPLRAVSKGFTRALGVELYPWGAVRLLGLSSVQSMTFTSVSPALERLGRQIPALLRSDATVEALELLEDWLLARAKQVSLEQTVAIVAATRLYDSGGQGKIADIAAGLNLSTRQLERGFQAQVGISPKQLARTIRFDVASKRVLLEPKLSLTELAFDLGYADQAHFNREFRAFSHMNPSAFIRYILERHGPLELEENVEAFKNKASDLYNFSRRVR